MYFYPFVECCPDSPLWDQQLYTLDVVLCVCVCVNFSIFNEILQLTIAIGNFYPDGSHFVNTSAGFENEICYRLLTCVESLADAPCSDY